MCIRHIRDYIFVFDCYGQNTDDPCMVMAGLHEDHSTDCKDDMVGHLGLMQSNRDAV